MAKHPQRPKPKKRPPPRDPEKTILASILMALAAEKPISVDLPTLESLRDARAVLTVSRSDDGNMYEVAVTYPK